MALAANAVRYEGTLYEFSNIISVSMTEKIWLKKLMERCIQVVP